MEIPGPGQYFKQSSVSLIQNNFGNIVFGKSRRLQEVKETRKRKLLVYIKTTHIDTPGPGAYRAQSDFGFYAADDILNTTNSLLDKKRQPSVK